MKNLIEALQIFLKYQNLALPTHCEHDVLYIMGIGFEEVSEEDQKALKKLGFHYSPNDGCWLSFTYGSA